jgi:hypothetical protein
VLVFRFIASYGLAVAVFVFLLIDTYFGTVAQQEMGLYLAQQKYFESYFLLHPFQIGESFSLPIPLPGGMLLLTILFFNILCGGIIRARKKGWSHLGMLIAHGSILVLLAGSMLEHLAATRGNLKLDPGQTADYYSSYFDWDVEVSKADAAPGSEALVIPYDHIKDLYNDQSRTFVSEKLPFDVRISGYAINAEPRPSNPNTAERVVDGFYIERLEKAKDEQGNPSEEMNIGGAYLDLIDKKSGEKLAEGILWGISTAPFSAEVNGETWLIDMTRRKWMLPFSVTLDTFSFELHPRTNSPRDYTSEVTRKLGGETSPEVITMNEPLRNSGFVVYQSSYGPPGAQPGDPSAYSVFAVADNPADQIPTICCILVGIGLLIHFLIKLIAYIARMGKTRAAAAEKVPPLPASS